MTTTAFAVPAMQPNLATVLVGGDMPRNVHKSTIYKLGISEIVHGCLLCALCVASIIFAAAFENPDHYYYYDVQFSFVSPGIWCGMFAIISGGLGVCAKKTPSVCMYNANMVMSIISALFMAVLFSLSIVSALIVGETVLIILQGVMAVGSLSAMILNIVHSAYCCAGVCCLKRKGGVILPFTTTTRIGNGQQYVQLPNGQYALLQAQPFLGSGHQVTSIPNMGMPVPAPQFPQPGLPQYPGHQVDRYKQLMSPSQPPSYDGPSFPTGNPNQM